MLSPSVYFSQLPLLCAVQCKAAFRVCIKNVWSFGQDTNRKKQNFLGVKMQGERKPLCHCVSL